jgi:signal peptidase I
MKIIPKFLSETWWGNVVLGILSAAIFYFLILRLLLGTDLPMVAVVSNSMKHESTIQTTHYNWLKEKMGYNETYINSWPVKNGFSVGDMPIIRGVEEYKVGDVIVYSVSGSSAPIIHRIIKVNDDGSYQTKGDNNNGQLRYELSVAKQNVHGKVIFIIPKLGYFKVMVNKLLGI